MLLDFAGSVQHVDTMGEVRPGFHFAGTFDTSSLASLNRASSIARLITSRLSQG
jgi:hypothetical protein